MEFRGKDVNDVFPVAWHRMMSDDMVFLRKSRNGIVREAVTPVTTIFDMPKRRVLFHAARDANPFFHLFEAIWMLAGRQDVGFLAKFNPRMLDFSDDGKTITGSAYGKKWNTVLPAIVEMLRKDRSTRRAYIALSERNECGLDTKDTPCNVGISFHVRAGYLDMTVFNRSNDMIWGAYGANYVHFGFFQEYIAQLVDLEVGYLAQCTSNFHVYPEFEVCRKLVGNVDHAPSNPYEGDKSLWSTHMPVIRGASVMVRGSWEALHWSWQSEARFFINEYVENPGYEHVFKVNSLRWENPFFRDVAAPMFDAWSTWKTSFSRTRALNRLESVTMLDWRKAGQEWIERRADARERKLALTASVAAKQAS